MDTQKKTETGIENNMLATILYYLGILLRYRVLIISVTVICMVFTLGFAIATLYLPLEINPMPNIYSATAVIRLQTRESTLSMESLLASIGVNSSQSASSDNSQLVEYILNSGIFLDKLVEEFGIIEKHGITDRIKTNSREYIRVNSTNHYDRNTGLMYISFVSTEPEYARDFVNRKVELLQEWFLNEGGSLRSRQMQLLESRMHETRSQINEMETKIREFQTTYGVLSVDALADQLETILSDLQTQLVQVDMEINQYTLYSRIEDPSLSRLRAQRQNIVNMIKEIDNGYDFSGRTLPSREQLSDLSIQFTRLSLDLQIQRDIYQALAQRYEVLRLSAIEENVFTVVEWGEIPEDKIGPYRGRMCINATLISFCASVLIALGVHFLRLFFTDPKNAKMFNYLKGKGND